MGTHMFYSFVFLLMFTIGGLTWVLFYSTLLLGYNTFIHMINSTLLYYNFYFTILGINITFIPLHFLGFNSMPRRIPDYPYLIISWNFLSSSGSSLTVLGFLFIKKKKKKKKKS